MKLATIASFVAAGSSALVFCNQQAEAAYLGLGVKLHSTVNISGVQRSVFRVYAVFNSPDDYVSSIAGSDILGPLKIESRNFTDTAAGSNFFNAGGGSTAPLTSKGAFIAGPNAQWDTFATIGADTNDLNVADDDATSLSPGFPTFINGNSLTGNMAWFTPGPKPQGQSGGPNGISGAFYTVQQGFVTGQGVLIAQLTVNAGDSVRGTVAVGVNIGGGSGVSIANQAFGFIPAPSALPLLALASVAPRRRRI